jgi:hypothetical protein
MPLTGIGLQQLQVTGTRSQGEKLAIWAQGHCGYVRRFQVKGKITSGVPKEPNGEAPVVAPCRISTRRWGKASIGERLGTEIL